MKPSDDRAELAEWKAKCEAAEKKQQERDDMWRRRQDNWRSSSEWRHTQSLALCEALKRAESEAASLRAEVERLRLATAEQLAAVTGLLQWIAESSLAATSIVQKCRTFLARMRELVDDSRHSRHGAGGCGIYAAQLEDALAGAGALELECNGIAIDQAQAAWEWIKRNLEQMRGERDAALARAKELEEHLRLQTSALAEDLAAARSEAASLREHDAANARAETAGENTRTATGFDG